MAEPDLNRLTIAGNGWPAEDVQVDARDALSEPDNDLLRRGHVHFLPRGAAFGTPDGVALDETSNWSKLVAALSVPFERLYARGHGLTLESRALSVVELLPDWERDHGLPDQCTPADISLSQRYRDLLVRVRSTGVITPADFVDLALQVGFVVEVEEVFGFECGFSECAGEHEAGSIEDEFTSVMNVYNVDSEFFRCGESECGFSALFQYYNTEELVCRVRSLLPGWQDMVFNFTSVTAPDYLVWLDAVWPDKPYGFKD